MYISDTMENGVKSMRNNLEFRWNNSEFLQKYVPFAKFTDVRWEFKNADDKRLTIRGFGATTGVRGFKEYGERPTWCGMDDLMSDKNAESPTIIRDIKNIVYKAARQAMHPKKRIVIWTGTPFNKSDPFYEAASSNAWNVRVYPICEKFPCSKKEFKGAWEDRFPYSFVKNEYYSLLESGEISSFNQELMLRITSEESRLVVDSDLVWYNRDLVVKNRSKFNFYITTDFATSDGKKSDLSVCGVWAYTNNGEWLLVDGFCKRQLMDKNINQLFRYVSIYKPLSVGIEINGQQKGFIQWLKGEMINRNIFFNFARQGSVEGIRRSVKKIASFKLFVPQIKAKKVWLPEEMKKDALVTEIVEELTFVTDEGFQSKHDDAGDMMSMLVEMDPYKPGEAVEVSYTEDEDGNHGMFVDDEEEGLYTGSTIF
jgi:phage terminase large subunit-like protein